ncbi:MAG TPA: TIGR03435 family protein [Acidisarcina sp.]
MSLFRWALICVFVLIPALAQSQTFERITIKPAGSADSRSTRLQVLPDGELIAHAIPVIDLISYAYDVPSNPSPRLNSLPDWTYGDRYDIEAETSPNAIAPTSRDGETQLKVKQMIRRLLADRFGLLMRVDLQRMPAYAMTVSSSGLRLQRSAVSPKDCILDTAPEGCHAFVIGFGHPLNANAVSMDDLVCYIENWTDLPPVNRTKLSGLFTMHTEGWLPMRLPPPPPNGNGRVDFSSLPTIFTVLSKLGLELHRQEEVLPVYTINQVDRPAIN